MNPDKTYTYDPKWTMHAMPKDVYIRASLPASDMPLEVQPLPFFWWLNPWKHMELLFDAYRDHAEVANEWRDRYHQQERLWKADAAERDEAMERLRDDLDMMRGERDAANDAVRTLRKKGRRRG